MDLPYPAETEILFSALAACNGRRVAEDELEQEIGADRIRLRREVDREPYWPCRPAVSA